MNAIKYFSNPKKVVATYDGLDCGVAKGTPRQLAELLLAYHHDPRARRVCRTAIISVRTPKNASKGELDDIDRRLLQAARDFQKFMRIASMLGWVHGDTATRHIHLLFANSNGRRTLDLRPKFLKAIQDMAWTIQFLSGRGKGRRKALPMYPKAKRLDTRILAVALLDSNGKLRKDRWDKMVKAGKITDFRLRTNGSLVSFQFQGRRIRLSTLVNFLGLLGGQTSAGSGLGENQTEAMITLIDPNTALPDELQEAFKESGFTSKDVQDILKDIREAQGHVRSVAPLNQPKQSIEVS
ncbi:MAG: hypothetical protein WCH99_22545 [Verrucomicrobiota bacterium]